MKKSIYLLINGNWKKFEYENLSEISTELIGSDVRIGSGVYIESGVYIGKNGNIPKNTQVKSIWIKGSKYSIYWWGENKVNIGCWQFSFSDWLKELEKGNTENFDEKEISEYLEYLNFIKSQWVKFGWDYKPDSVNGSGILGEKKLKTWKRKKEGPTHEAGNFNPIEHPPGSTESTTSQVE